MDAVEIIKALECIRQMASLAKVTFGGAGVSIGSTGKDFDLVFSLSI